MKIFIWNISILILLLLSKESFGQYDYWKVHLPGYNTEYYNAEIDFEGNLNLVVNGVTIVAPDKFISFDKEGYVVFNQSISETAIMNFRDTSGNRYLVSYLQPNIRIQKFDANDTLLWNHSELLQFPPIISNSYEEFLMVESASHLFLSNGSLVISGLYHIDITTPCILFIDPATGIITNEYYGPGSSQGITEIYLQEDDNQNINMAYFSEISDVFHIDKINQSGTLILQVLFGNILDFITVAFENSANHFYIGMIDFNTNDLVVTKVDKNTLGDIYTMNTGISNFQYGDKFGATDSAVFITSNAQRRIYVDGLLKCTYPGLSYTMVCRDITLYSLGSNIGMLDTTCTYTIGSMQFDNNTTQFFAHHILDQRFPNDYFTNNDIIYVVSKNNSGVIGVVAIRNPLRKNYSGKLYYDVNNNCLADGIEPGIPNQLIRLNSTGKLVFTEQNGYFENSADTGSYTLEAIPFNTTLSRCPVTIPVLITDTVTMYSGNNLGIQDQVGNLQDLSVTVNQNQAIPGFNTHIFVHVQNQQPLPASGKLKMTFDSNIFTVTNTNPTVDSISGNEYFWNIDSLQYLVPFVITSNLTVDTLAVSGTTFYTHAHITNVISENNISNNMDVYQGEILSSYDPNNKSVTPKGYGSIGLISPADSILRYRINFQNTGTYMAYKVFIIDTLDASLDISTFQFLSASHPCQLSFIDDHVIQFTFEDIMLPDSGTNELLSHGYINYTIHTYSNLPVSIEIKNRASIFFDYNPPIITNQTINTIGVLGYEDVIHSTQILIYPNPTNNQLHVVTRNDDVIQEISIYNVEGKLISQKRRGFEGNHGTFIISDFEPGYYFIKVQTAIGMYVKKFIKI